MKIIILISLLLSIVLTSLFYWKYKRQINKFLYKALGNRYLNSKAWRTLGRIIIILSVLGISISSISFGVNFLYRRIISISGGDPTLQDPASKKDLALFEERVMREMEGLSRYLTPTSFDPRDYPQPSDEAREKAQSLSELLEQLQLPGVDMPLSYQLAEGLAEIANGDYDNGKTKILKYIARIEAARNETIELVNEKLILSYKSLGDAEYYSLNYQEALNWYNMVLELSPDNTDALNSAGFCLRELAKYDSALSYFEKATAVVFKSGRTNDTEYASCLNNMGSVIIAKGDYHGALENFKKALRIDLEVFGEKHPNIALRYNNIGFALYEIGDYHGALENFNKAQKITIEILGEDHRHIATYLNNIGSVLHAMEDYDGALENYYKALKIDLEIFGENHPQATRSYNNIGEALREKGDYDSALVNFNKALKIYIEIFGEDHPYVAWTLNSIGLVFLAKEDYDGALGNHLKALRIDLEIFGENHPTVAGDFNNLAGLYFYMGEPAKGLLYIIKAYKIYFKFLGPDHPDTKNSRRGVKWHGGDPDAVEREVREEMEREARDNPPK